MKVNLQLLRQMGLLSAIIGLLVGLISNIPFIGNLVFVLYFIGLSAGLIIYLKRINILGTITVKEGGVVGAIIGATSFMGFCVAYLPIRIIIGFISDNFISSIITSGFTNFPMFFTLVFLLIMMALLCALMNAFAGGVTAYIYELLEEYKKDNSSDFQSKLR